MNISILYSGPLFVSYTEIFFIDFFSAELYDRTGKWRQSRNKCSYLNPSTERETWTRGLEKKKIKQDTLHDYQLK